MRLRADRLLTLLMLLQTRKKVTAQTLAKRLEVSERTIYRDLEALGSAGIPVYAERGPGGGWMLLEDYRTNLTRLTETEARTLFMSGIAGPMLEKRSHIYKPFRMRYGIVVSSSLPTAEVMEASKNA